MKFDLRIQSFDHQDEAETPPFAARAGTAGKSFAAFATPSESAVAEACFFLNPRGFVKCLHLVLSVDVD